MAQAELYRAVQIEYEKDSILFAWSLAEQHWFASLVFEPSYMVLPQAGHDVFALFPSSPALRHINLFINLHSVSLNLIRIDSGLCTALQNFPRLQKITLFNCTIEPHLDAPQVQIAWVRNLITVLIIFP